jgi:hypothetical protein
MYLLLSYILKQFPAKKMKKSFENIFMFGINFDILRKTFLKTPIPV